MSLHPAFSQLDAFIYLERAISEKGIYPAVDPLASSSRILDPHYVGEHHYRVQVSGVPRAVIQTYVGMATVFMLEALAGAGAKEVEQQMTVPRLGPSVHGQATMQFERELRWR